MSDFFPFHRLGLTRNPFGSLAPGEWADVAVLPRPVIEIVEAGFDHVQVLGEKGRGKTSVLMGIRARLTPSGLQPPPPYMGEGKTLNQIAYERIPENARRFQTPLDGLDCFLLDEAQRLGWGEWRRLLRAARGGLRLVVGSHRDHTRQFARWGLRLATLRLGEIITRDHVAAVVEKRIEYFRLDGDRPFPTVAPDAIDALVTWYGSDLRAMESLLYEVFQGLEEPGPVTAEVLARYR